MAVDLDSYEVWLLIDGTMVFPFSSHGFHFAQGRVERLVQRSSTNLFLRADGSAHRIASVHPIRNDMVAGIGRLFGFPFEIRVELTPHDVDLDDLKSKLLLAFENDSSLGEGDESWPFATRPLAEVTSAIQGATSAKELYAVLELPAPRDCLDLL